MQVIDLPARHGGLWIRDAFALFRAQLPGWLAITACWLLLMFSALVLPVAAIVMALLQPAFFAGFALACREQENGGRVGLRHLFMALRQNPGPLLVTGAAIFVFDGMLLLLLQIVLNTPPPAPVAADALPIDQLRALLEGRELLLAIFFSVDSMLRTLLWFVSPLLAFQPMPAWHAARWSAYASLSNLPALGLFGLLMLLMFLLGTLPAGLGLLVAMPLMAIANYTSYRQVFRE